VFKVVQGHRCW